MKKYVFVRRVAVSAFAISCGFGLTATLSTPALAADCTLSIGPEENDHYRVTVVCSSGSSPSTFDLWGQDTPFDERRATLVGNGDLVHRSVLNEDDYIGNREDEIYATTLGLGGRTNTVARRF